MTSAPRRVALKERHGRVMTARTTPAFKPVALEGSASATVATALSRTNSVCVTEML
jgi:hypothetical protein